MIITDIFRIVVNLTRDVGCRVITVDAKENAVGFYSHFAFAKSRSGGVRSTTHMYLDIKRLIERNT